MRRTVPLTRNASSLGEGCIVHPGIFPAAAVSRRMVKVSLVFWPRRKASWTVMVLLDGHLGPQEATEFASDGGGDDVARGLALGQAPELGAQVELGVPGPGHGVG